jgi:prepilin-type N-terminal cleavage/methylation domain-containing protein
MNPSLPIFRPSRVRQGNRDGITIIEMVVTVVVIGILATIALPKLNLHRFRVDAGLRQVEVALQQAERAAIQRQHDVLVSFDVSGGRIRIVDDVNNDGIAESGERTSWKVLEDGIKFSAPSSPLPNGGSGAVAGGNLISVDAMPTIIFRRDGAASSDLQAYLTSNRNKSEDFRALQVNRATGRVDWYRLRTAGWVRGNGS